MDKANHILRTAAPLAIIAVILLMAMPRSPKLSYEFRKGQPWNYETLIASFDFPILKTAEELEGEKAAASDAVVPYFRYSEEIASEKTRQAAGIALGDYRYLRTALVRKVQDLYGKGIVADDGLANDSGNFSTEVIYVQRNKRAVKQPVGEVWKLSDARARLLSTVQSSFPGVDVDSVFRTAGVYELIVPNLVYDGKTTQLMLSESDRSISPSLGYVSSGQLIVSQGEIVTAEIEQLLRSYEEEYRHSFGYKGPAVFMWLGNFLIVLSLVVLLFFVLYFGNPEIFNEYSRYLYLLVVFTIFALAGLIAPRFSAGMVYLIPFTLCALFLQAFFRNRLVVTVYFTSLLPLLISSRVGFVPFTMFLLAGMVSVFAFRFYYKGWHQFITGLVIFIVLTFVYSGFYMADYVKGDYLHVLLLLGLSSLLSVFGYQFVFLFEKLFNLVSNSRLLDLCDSSNPLLRELEQKAPGTFHHSLQVMNMADKVARDIGADQALVRAGSLYHDIGKMNNPMCFIENESMLPEGRAVTYHSELTPLQSAKDIIRHVTDGEEAAVKAGLPSVIVDFIRTHHGTGTVSFFFDKYVKAGGDASDIADFSYPGPLPSSKEQVIVCLCDSIEAASRSLKDKSVESFSNLVDSIVDSKIESGQMAEAGISLKELGIVRDTLKTHLMQMYHGRIVYPKTRKQTIRNHENRKETDR